MSRHRSLRSTAIGTLTLALVGGALFAATATAATPRGTSAPRIVACTTGGLVEWLNTQGNGAAGTIYYDLEFTNLSGHVCTLRGYPGVSGISLAGSQLGSAADRVSSGTIHTVTVGVGKTVTALLGIVDIGVFSPAQCHPTTAAGLRVYAPNQTAPKTIPFPFGACSKPTAHYLNIEAVK